MRLNLNQKGFGVVEGLLSVIAITLVAGVGFYVMHSSDSTKSSLDNTSSKNTTKVATPNPSTPPSTPETDEEQIIAVVKNYSGAGGSQQKATVTVDSIKDVNAMGRVKSGTTADDGFAAQFIVHKDTTGWTVIYEGQQAPGSALGKKYSLPQAWYSTDY